MKCKKFQKIDVQPFNEVHSMNRKNLLKIVVSKMYKKYLWNTCQDAYVKVKLHRAHTVNSFIEIFQGLGLNFKQFSMIVFNHKNGNFPEQLFLVASD